MANVKIWVKKQLRLEPLTFKQRDMVDIGSAGLLSVFKRLALAQGPNDSAAKPLSPYYARYKSRMRKGNRRNLFLTGQLLESLKLRTVSDNRAYAAPDARQRSESRLKRKANKSIAPVTNKMVGNSNQRREPWLVFSPINKKAVMDKAMQVLVAAKQRLLRRGS